MKHYYVTFGSSTQMFVIATFKNNESGAIELRDTINKAISELNPLAFAFCHVLSFVDNAAPNQTDKN